MENVKVFLDGKLINDELPYLFDDFSVKINFLNDSIEQYQADLDVNELNFSGESAKFIQKFVANNGVFRKLDIIIEVEGVKILDGYLHDFTFSADKNIVKSKFSIKDGLNNLSERLQSLSALILADKYTLKDLEFVIEPTDEESKERLLVLGLAAITYTYISIQITKEINTYIASLTNISPGATLSKIAEGVALGLYTAAIIVAIGKYFIELKKILFPSVRRTKVISIYNLVEVPLDFLGYRFVTNIEDMKNVHFWASRYSKKQQNQVVQGLTFNKKVKNPKYYIPNSNDRVENCLELFRFIQEKYTCRFFVKDNIVYCYHKEDSFWEKLSPHQLEDDIPLDEFFYNTNEHITSKATNYSIDDLDQYTIEDFKGSHFIVTSQLPDWKKSTAKGFKDTNYGMARASRKDRLNLIEKAFDNFAKSYNKVANVLGINNGNGVLATRLGVAKISSDKFSVAKLVYLEGSKIPKDAREKLSAKRDYEQWGWADSFVLNKKNKKKIYQSVKIKCDLIIFTKILNNKYITLKTGENAEIRKFEWKQRRNYATCTLAVENDYEIGMTEEYYESEQ
jgi:hypothetical protein